MRIKLLKSVAVGLFLLGIAGGGWVFTGKS